MRIFRPVPVFLALLPLTACDPIAEPVPEAATLSIDAPTDILVEGRSARFEIDARTATGGVAPPPDVTWSSSDEAVATVSAVGIVTAVAVGEATITATADVDQASVGVRVAPASIPLFASPPFEGEYDVWNAFDHDIPEWSGQGGQILTWLGYNTPGLEGHDGFDWPMPENTPLFAVGDGVVTAARSETPWQCPLKNNQLVSANYVVLLHEAPGGERFLSQYLHLNRMDVQAGDTVSAGDPIGLSGNTGCSTGPHLHFEVAREFYQRAPEPGFARVTDPNGWEGQQDDPWLIHNTGAASSWLWVQGSAPPFLVDRTPGLRPLDMNRVPPVRLPERTRR